MVAPELLQYITQNKAAGFSEEQIIVALRAAGWAEDAIAEALSGSIAVSGGSVATPPTNPQTGPSTEEELARIQNELAQANNKFHPHQDPHEQSQGGGLTGVLVRKHIVQNEAQANILMILISVISISISVWIVWPKGNNPPAVNAAIPPLSAPNSRT